MGALHEGHLSLIRAAKRECEACVVSIFVNPLQFGPNEDFERYPRDERRDFELAEATGADVVFAPVREEIYREGFSTTIQVGPIGDIWEGAARPGHFDGVATVVAKLFNIVKPTVAYFGEKDFQQCVVIANLVRDLNMGIELRFLPTVREADGLAMSSRNAYLSQEERGSALAINEALASAKEAMLGGVEVSEVIKRYQRRMEDAGLSVDYFALVDGSNMMPVQSISNGSRLIAAAYAGRTRLIDNMLVK